MTEERSRSNSKNRSVLEVGAIDQPHARRLAISYHHTATQKEHRENIAERGIHFWLSGIEKNTNLVQQSDRSISNVSTTNSWWTIVIINILRIPAHQRKS